MQPHDCQVNGCHQRYDCIIHSQGYAVEQKYFDGVGQQDSPTRNYGQTDAPLAVYGAADGFPDKNAVYGSKEGSHGDPKHPLLKKSPIMGESILCGQCHGDKFRDWKVGVHGKRTGESNGKKEYLLCAHCHNPHDPAFKPIRPMPPPVRPESIR